MPSSTELEKNFCDLHPPLNLHQAKIEASRCYYCFDAPCITACPTHIDIPSFIRKISSENIKGAAVDILSENIFGSTCARVCPVESLCEGSCVRTKAEEKPVTIGALQRFSTDYIMERKIQPFRRATTNGKRVAVVGAGPAGLTCAHRLSTLGYEVVVFEANEKPGGLNEYGLAPYKMVNDIAQREIKFILEIGGIEIQYQRALGKDLRLRDLQRDFDAVFLGIGLQGVNELKLENEKLPNVLNAVEYISELRQAKDLRKLKMGRRVVVIGGGSTAIDIAMESKRLGAESVRLVYRRGEEDMKSTSVERELAKADGVFIETWVKPIKIIGNKDGVQGVEFERRGEKFTFECDMLFKAIGQVLVPGQLGDAMEVLNIKDGRILVDENRRTSASSIYAGGDCINGGALTVTSVQDGKIAALAIHQDLSKVSKNG